MRPSPTSSWTMARSTSSSTVSGIAAPSGPVARRSGCLSGIIEQIVQQMMAVLDDLRPYGNVDVEMVTATVELPADHPGFSDPDYRRRREAIAAVATAFRPGER